MSDLDIKDLEGVKVQAARIKKFALSILPREVDEIKQPLKGVITESFAKVGNDTTDLATMVKYLAEYIETMEQRINLIERNIKTIKIK